jgi:uridine kinase
MNIKVYQSGLKFMLIDAVSKLYNGEVIYENSLDHGVLATINLDRHLEEEDVEKIKEFMHKLVEKNIPFNKKIVSKKDAFDFYMRHGMEEKAKNIQAVTNISVSIYEFNGSFNYMYSHAMPKTSGEITDFDLIYADNNKVILVYPFKGELDFNFKHKIYDMYEFMRSWSRRIKVNYVSDLNEIIAQGKIADFVRKIDLLMDMEMFQVAERVIKEEKKIVLLAGPSSSGKTTTSKKLSNALSSMGYEAIPLTLDDYFLERDETPLLPDGSKDYESINCLDLKLFNKQMKALLNGEEVVIPTYDFVSGTKLYTNAPIQLKENEVLVIEGLHAINPNLFFDDYGPDIYKCYVSPFSPLKIDRHNYISSTDNRLLRRIARDFRTRGRSAESSLAGWSKVRDGEEEYIFPYTDTVDSVINTSAIYEIGVLKVILEPLLLSVPLDSEQYTDARRLLDSIRNFYPISSEYVSKSSVLREFIGGSIYDVK